MKLIVGLGNPGAEYQGTRHNVGFDVVDELARRWKARPRIWKSLAELAQAADRGAMLAKPQTFMNASGEAVARVASFYKFEPSDILVVVDDVQLPLGRLRFRSSGSAGGHNGLKSVIEHLGPEFSRLRIGVGRGDPRWDLSDHVLSPFRPEERELVQQTIPRAADAVETFVENGIAAAMNRWNAVEGEKDPPAEERGTPLD
jgi:PTH1 family peptidyl-tRNA hydrolase